MHSAVANLQARSSVSGRRALIRHGLSELAPAWRAWAPGASWGRAADAQSGVRLDGEHDFRGAFPPARPPAIAATPGAIACVPTREADDPLSLGARVTVPGFSDTAEISLP